jgi:ATP-dependent RNA helicase RhlB
MGFIPDVRQIIHSTPHKTKRQTMFFSATLTTDVVRLANQWTRDAVSIEIEPEQVAVDSVDQRLYVVKTEEKFPLLLNIIEQDQADRVMVFANRRDQTRKLYELLQRYQISCELLSGDVPQSKRIRTLERFRSGEFRVLVATDVAGRGLHVDNVSHVVNFTLPQDPEDYVHRIGRTGRAGASGISISFACEQDAFQIPAIEEYIKNDLPCTHPEPELLEMPEPPALTEEQKKKLERTRAENVRNRPARSSGGRGRSGGQRSGGNSRRGTSSRRGR